ncbi:hypothetical protein IWQ56_000564 [Coemansia nantahalensis]|uniref:Uncharacterized protein n=2 Tax=Coemansia TaxID=4863 RepID=A0ACC1LB30_9FUNG|nr:hypothetical protein IWQ56_000564 [Coemansia nantahalensis]KAJ2775688.1 hypothetical protein IWQ57_000258 [Coemansia nantahalensis]KAJ2803991.1 hypothetical protein H4R21_001815 [Coemansia helicoidea]
MFIAYIFDGSGKYLAPWICSPTVAVADIKRYAALYLRVPPGRIALHAPDISGATSLPDKTTFDESKMPLMEGWKWVIVCVTAPATPEDSEPIVLPGHRVKGGHILSRL